jgi:hypothetical protein
MFFGYLKRILGLERHRLRGHYGANNEFLLAATAQNLLNLAKISPAPQQTRKAQKKGPFSFPFCSRADVHAIAAFWKGFKKLSRSPARPPQKFTVC